MTDTDQMDPRDPRDVVVQQGISPNLGPRECERKSSVRLAGGRAARIFLLIAMTMRECAEALG